MVPLMVLLVFIYNKEFEILRPILKLYKHHFSVSEEGLEGPSIFGGLFYDSFQIRHHSEMITIK